jgi:hypothetical protein
MGALSDQAVAEQRMSTFEEPLTNTAVGLRQSWPEFTRLALEAGTPRPEQAGLFAGA